MQGFVFFSFKRIVVFENRFFSHTIHPEHTLLSLQSSQLPPLSLRSTPPAFSLQKSNCSLHDATEPSSGPADELRAQWWNFEVRRVERGVEYETAAQRSWHLCWFWNCDNKTEGRVCPTQGRASVGEIHVCTCLYSQNSEVLG